MNSHIIKPFRSGFISILALIISGLIFFFSPAQSVLSATTSELNNADSTVIEFLKLSVTKKDREAWLTAEKESWEPWLNKQKGFLKRELFWDPENEEALLLISWASRLDWKTIPQSEIDKVQHTFEELAMELTRKYSVNPFPMKSQGELLPQ